MASKDIRSTIRLKSILTLYEILQLHQYQSLPIFPFEAITFIVLQIHLDKGY